MIKIGSIVKHGPGPTAISRVESLHAGGYHATHCLGGMHFVHGSKIRLATSDEINRAKKSRFYCL